ncbi:TolC family protein [Xanthovirga aplysinae]|uniref:TolC family protein n=1 Tax=Xanthovirga aplysinae TaxID=2529853 RepID=UPI0012BC8CB5|nr:TolC family protein [Xanthovirga aplysinae]MTI33249.1 hypothetical protein [Xanthovirga aplysinae]
MKRLLGIILSIVGIGTSIFAQQREVGLEEVILMAQQQSFKALIAEKEWENSQWAFHSFKANLRPQLALNGVFPDYTSAYTQVTQPDGKISWEPVRIMNSSMQLALSQPLSFTGGTITLSSALNRFDDIQDKNYSYNTAPMVLGWNQPFFQYNPLKWDKKIEPLRLEEAKKKYSETLERVAVEVNRLYFQALQAQIAKEMAAKNQENNEKLLLIAQTRFNLGKSSKSDLMQLELAVVNAQKQSAQASLRQREAIRQLKSYLNDKGTEDFRLKLPEDIPFMKVDAQIALEKAEVNRKEFLSFRRQMLEAEDEVAQAKGNTGFSANLETRLGYNNQANGLSEAYKNPIDQQAVRLSFNFPIMDWGRAKARRQTALAKRAMVAYDVEQQQLDFQQGVLTQVDQFKVLVQQFGYTQKADELANQRYNIAMEQFSMGRLTITDFIIALNEKDRARVDYIAAISDFWEAYYTIRFLTLYDFMAQRDIVYLTAN